MAQDTLNGTEPRRPYSTGHSCTILGQGNLVTILVHTWIHFLATSLVALGAILSAFWILAANSWMQTPAGYKIVNGKFMVTHFSAAIFNPSLPVRMSHMTMASFETSARSRPPPSWLSAPPWPLNTTST